MVNPINRINAATGATHASNGSQPTTTQGKGSGPEAGAISPSRDSVALSHKAQLAKVVSAAASQSSGIDWARVEAVRNSLQNSRYTVSPNAIAKAVAEAVWLVRKQ